MPVATALSFLGIAKEATKGTGVAATNFIPVKAPSPFDNQQYLVDDALRGSMAAEYGEVAGVQWSEFEFGGPVFADSIGWALAGILGSVATLASRTVADGVLNSTTTVTSATAAFTIQDVGRPISGTGIPAGATIVARASATSITISAAATATGGGVSITIGAASQYSHLITLNNGTDGQATAYSLTDFYGVTQARRYPAQQFAELGIKWGADGMLEYVAKSMGFISEQVTKPTQSFTAVTPTPGWEIVTSIAGAAIAYCESGEFNLKRPVTVIHSVDGTQAPYKVWQGPLAIDGKLVLVVEDDTELTRYLTNTQPALLLAAAHGAGASLVEVRAQASNAAYTVGKIVRGKDYTQLEVDFKAVANTTDAGSTGGYAPGRVTVQNALASGTYV